MNDKDILKKMKEEPINLAFRDKDNYKSFLEFLDRENQLYNKEGVRILFDRHHITFWYLNSDGNLITKGWCMYGIDQDHHKELVYYEDLSDSIELELI